MPFRRRKTHSFLRTAESFPDIGSPAAMADWLNITAAELKWLANALPSTASDSARMSQHYVCRWIRKRSCGWRLLESPKAKLKVVQRQIVDDVLAKVDPHPLSFGFRTGGNVIDFARPHVRRPFCMKLDIADFFPTITTGRVHGLFRQIGFDHDASHQLALLATVQSDSAVLSRVMPFAHTMSNETTRLFGRRHLPQGAPSSPMIANLCASGLDRRLAGLARSLGGVHYTRYADDILLSGDADFARQAKRVRILIGAIALEEGFAINFHKTRMMRQGARQSACGIVLNQKLNIDRRHYDELKAILHNCIQHGARSQNRQSQPHFQQHLGGRISWFEQINPLRGQKLRAMFEQIDFGS